MINYSSPILQGFGGYFYLSNVLLAFASKCFSFVLLHMGYEKRLLVEVEYFL